MAGRRMEPGEVLAGYEVISELGSGGMGSVYLARHPRLPRNQALKVLAAALGDDPAFRERFRREADLAAQLDHPNIVAVQDAGVDGDRMWIAMQYVEGTDAAALVRDDGPLAADRAFDIVAQVAAGLDHAHDQGMLHRDVKPANILVTPGWEKTHSQRVLISDFGIARSLAETSGLTSTGTMIGTLAYAAPEMLSTAPLTPAVDQYALGCTLYELLVGSVVFPRPTKIAIMHAHANDAVPRVTDVRGDLPPAIDDVIARALAKDPADRYRSCREFVAAATDALSRGGAATLAGDLRFTEPGTPRSPAQTPVPGATGTTAAPGQPTQTQPSHIQPAQQRGAVPESQDRTTVRHDDRTTVRQPQDQTTVARGQNQAGERTTVHYGPPRPSVVPAQQPTHPPRQINPTLPHDLTSGPVPQQYSAAQPPGLGGPPAGIGPRPSERPRRSRVPIIAGAVAAVVVVVVLVAVFLWPSGSTDTTADGTTTGRPATTGQGTTAGSTTDEATTSRPTDTTTSGLAGIAGTWRGEFTYGDERYGDVLVSITSVSPLKATVKYPARGCEGTWTERERTDTVIKIDEHSTTGSCTDARIELSADPGGTLSMYSVYYAPSKGTEVYPAALLNRS